MKVITNILGYLVLLVAMFIATALHSQEEKEIVIEESAEVSLEDITDDFQENFFEALKQKGIENYDRAINLLLKCKQIDAENRVVDHELAKSYLRVKNLASAQDYSMNALISNPDNQWYLDTFIEILEKQGQSIEDFASSIPLENLQLQENLAVSYFKRGKLEAALKVLENLKSSSFNENLSSKIKDSIKKRNTQLQTNKVAPTTNNSAELTLIESFRERINTLIDSKDNNSELLQVSEEAIDTYPSQPFFYYAQGHALNNTTKYQGAVDVLEAALDYLINDTALANKIYTELAKAYNGLNDSVKANMYLRKIKPGF